MKSDRRLARSVSFPRVINIGDFRRLATIATPEQAKAYRDVLSRPITDDGLRVARFSHQPDVAKLRHAIHEDHIGRFDVAMHQAVLVQVRESRRQREPDQQAVGDRQAVVAFQFETQRAGLVELEVSGRRSEVRFSGPAV